MASLVARSRPWWAATVCDSCLVNLSASRQSVTGSLRFFSIAAPTTRGRRILDGERAAYPRFGLRSRPSNAQKRPRRYNSTQESPPASGPPFISRAPPRPVPTSEAGCSRLSHRRLIALSGPDSAKFLQGLLTNNVDPSRETPFYAAFLDARGRMLWDVFIWTYPGVQEHTGTAGADWACYIEVDAAEVEALTKHLKRHKLRSKVSIKMVQEHPEDATKGVQVWASWCSGEPASGLPGSIVAIKDPRFIGDKINMQRSLVRPSNAASLEPITEDASLGEYHRLRYTYGIPEGQDEIPRESALPMEFNVDLSHGIDFKKGCYVGQELTIRTKHTGVVRKRILPVQLSHADAPQEPTDIHQQIPAYDGDALELEPARFDSADVKQLGEEGGIKKGRAAGKLIGVCGNVGLALCRLEMMTSMKISTEGGTWKPGMEFGVADRDGQVTKVRPFLRDEWVTRVRDIWDKKRTRI